jgi:hypothetical protein
MVDSLVVGWSFFSFWPYYRQYGSFDPGRMGIKFRERAGLLHGILWHALEGEMRASFGGRYRMLRPRRRICRADVRKK